MVARPSPGLPPFVCALALGLWSLACCVAPPRAQDLFAIGFRTPEQSFATFQTAVRADDPGLIRRCLSASFVARNGLSEQVFRTFWEQEKRNQPFLRKGVSDARLAGSVEVRGDRARIRAQSHGHELVVDLAREDFCEAWAGDEKLGDEAAPFGDRTGLQDDERGKTWIYGQFPLPSGLAVGRVTELRFGREWKIDGFEVVEEKKPAKVGGAHATVTASDDLP